MSQVTIQLRPKKEKKVKLPKGVTQEFLDDINSASADTLKTKIVQMQKGLEEAKDFLKNDPGVQDARTNLGYVVGPTKETIKTLENRTKCVIERMRSMGAL